MRRLILIIACVALIAASVVCMSDSNITVPKYSVIPVVLDDTIGSARNHRGDNFTCHVKDNKTYGFPAGTSIVGVIKSVSAKHGKTPGKMVVSFKKAFLPSGKYVKISAVPSTKDGMKKAAYSGKKGNSNTVENGAMIGGGLGLIFGKNLKGAVVGGAAGAGAGYLLKHKTGDVELKEGTSFYITLTKAVQVPSN